MDRNWEFLLQCKGETAWVPPMAERLALTEGDYRLALYDPSQGGAIVEVCLTYTDASATPPKCRRERRSCRADARGLAVVVPPTRFKPGCWQIRCYSDLMTELSGTPWHASLQLDVVPAAIAATEADSIAIVESVLAEAAVPSAALAPEVPELASPAPTPPGAPGVAPQPNPPSEGYEPRALRARLLQDLDRFLERTFTPLDASDSAAPDSLSLPLLPPSQPITSIGKPSGRQGGRRQQAITRHASTPKLPPVPGPRLRLREQITRLLQHPNLNHFEDSRIQRWEAAIATLPPSPHLPVLVPPCLETLGSPSAGQLARLRVYLPATSAVEATADAVKLWLLDGSGDFPIDDPKYLTQFTASSGGGREAIVSLAIPFGCAIARFEAIALQRESGRCSVKSAIERCVDLPSARRRKSPTQGRNPQEETLDC